MSTTAVVHLNFRDEARAALEFYRSAFGGRLTVATYGDLDPAAGPDRADRVIWGEVAAGDGFRVQAYDVQPELPWDRGRNSFYISTTAATPEAVSTLWGKLADGGTIEHPLGPAAWSPLYGKVRDRFGIVWVLSLARPDAR